MSNDLFEKIKKPATVYETGGFRPEKNLGESWVGRVSFCKPGETLPLDKDGREMSPLVMFFTETAPYVPEEIKAFKMISVYISYHSFFDHLVDCDFDGYFGCGSIRISRSLCPVSISMSTQKPFL